MTPVCDRSSCKWHGYEGQADVYQIQRFDILIKKFQNHGFFEIKGCFLSKQFGFVLKDKNYCENRRFYP
jgi:hypothetical protein